MLEMTRESALAQDDHAQMVQSFALTPEQRLCGAVVLRAVMDALGDARVSASHRMDAAEFILESSGEFSFDWFCDNAGMSSLLVLKIKRRVRDGANSEIPTQKQAAESRRRSERDKKNRAKAAAIRRRELQRALSLAGGKIRENHEHVNGCADEWRGGKESPENSANNNNGGLQAMVKPITLQQWRVVETVFRLVQEYSGYSAKALIGKVRNKKLVAWRHFAMREIYYNSGLSEAQIGKIFHRDHSTVNWALTKGDEQ